MNLEMHYDDWEDAVNKLMKSAETTAGDWDALLYETEAAARSSVGNWHIQQTLGLYAEAAAKLEERIGDDADEQIRFWHAASAYALALAALHHFENKNTAYAIALAKRALHHLGLGGDRFPIFETLIAQLRLHLEDAARSS